MSKPTGNHEDDAQKLAELLDLVPLALRGRLAEHNDTDCPVCHHGAAGQLDELLQEAQTELADLGETLRMVMRSLIDATKVMLQASGLPDDTDDWDHIEETLLGRVRDDEKVRAIFVESHRDLTEALNSLRLSLTVLSEDEEGPDRPVGGAGVPSDADREALHLGGLVLAVSNGDGFTVQIRGVKIAQCDTYGRTDNERSLTARAEAAEQQLADLRAGIDHWCRQWAVSFPGLAEHLRAALLDHPATTGGDESLHVHDRDGRLDRSICAACGDAYVECSGCGVYLCDCTRGGDES